MEGGQKERAAQIKVLAERLKKKLKIECKTRGATNQSPKKEQQKKERSKQYDNFMQFKDKDKKEDPRLPSLYYVTLIILVYYPPFVEA